MTSPASYTNVGTDPDVIKVNVRTHAPSAGLYVSLSSNNVDVPTAIPVGTRAVTLWFEAGSAVTKGRVLFNKSATVISDLTGTDNKMGYHPAQAVTYVIPVGATHLHLAPVAASTVVFGSWLT